MLTLLALLYAATCLLAAAILLSGIDDLYIDLAYWRDRLGGKSTKPVHLPDLRAAVRRPMAIMVPAWREAEVVAKMTENALRTVEYDDYVVFVGTYRNDPETGAEVDALCRQWPGTVVRAAVDRDGPTCKADCLNAILQTIAAYERNHAMEFAGVVLHDCEDVVHPLELLYCNAHLDRADLIQLPVFSLELPWHAFVGAAYLDEFSETHQKDLAVRTRWTGVVPGAGVAQCFSRRAIVAMATLNAGQVFNPNTLTEDYDFSFRLAELPAMRQHFAAGPVRGAEALEAGFWWRPATASGLLATCEYFPSQFRAAYRQRARWTLGIALLGWQQLGWRGTWRQRYMLARDRKGLLTAPLTMAAYAVVVATLVAASLGSPADALAPNDPTLWPLFAANLALLANRIVQRVYFVGRLNGWLHGLLAVPRIVVNNVVNFAAVSRAWYLWLRHVATGAALTWDKTHHTFPTHAALRRHRRLLGQMLIDKGLISHEHLNEALSQQRLTGMRLGQVLLARGRLEPDALADALAEQHALPRAGRDTAPMHDLGEQLAQLVRDHRIVPLAAGSDLATLEVAVANAPTPDVALAMRRVTGRHVAYVVACDHEVDRWVREYASGARKAGAGS